MNGTYLQVMGRQWKLILSVVIVAVVLSLVLSLLQKPLWRTSAELLIVPPSSATTDAYTASKSAQQLAVTMAEIIHSNSFLEAVLNGQPILPDNYGSVIWKRKLNWNQAVYTKVTDDTGFLWIDTYADSKYQSKLLADAVIATITNMAGDYLGSDKAATIKVIDLPVTYDTVAKPNIVGNVLLGAIAGVLAGVIMAFILPSDKTSLFLAWFKDIWQRSKGEQIFTEPAGEMPELAGEGGADSDDTPAPRTEAPGVVLDDGITAREKGSEELPVVAASPSQSKPRVVLAEEPVTYSLEEQEKNWLATGKISREQ